MRRPHPVVLVAALFLPVLAGCSQTTTTVHTTTNETTSFVAADRLFTMEFPTGWHVLTAEARQVNHWRFTPEEVPDAMAESPSEISVAWNPTDDDLDLNASSLAEIARYVRNAIIETEAEKGNRWRGESPVAGEIGGRETSRVDMVGEDAAGIAARVAIVVFRHERGALVVSFGCPESEVETLLPLLESCAASVRMP